MGGDTHFPGGLLFLDESVDDAAVFAVYAADAALLLQLFQGVVHGVVPDHHGGIGHVHLEGGDTGGVHIVDLRLDLRVPVVDGHVKAVVAAGAAVGLPVPQLQPVVQALPLVGAGEVHHGGGAAPQGRPGAGGEIVGSGGIAHVQIKMGMGVDEAGHQQHPGDVDDLVGLAGDIAAHLQDLFTLHQNIGTACPSAGDNGAASKQILHSLHSLPNLTRIYHRWTRASTVLSGKNAPILRQVPWPYGKYALRAFPCLTEFLLRQNCKAPASDGFSSDFWLLRCRRAGARQGEKDKKRRKDTLSGVLALVHRW